MTVRVGPGRGHRLADRVEDRQRGAVELHRLAALARGDPADDVGAGAQHAPGVLGALRAGHALYDDLGVLGQPDRHVAQTPAAASSAARCAAPSIVSTRVDQRVGRRVEDPAALLGVVAVQPHDERLGDLLAALGQQGQRGDDAVGDRVAGGDAAEHVDEDAAHRRVRQHDLQAVGHHLGRGAAADVEEVGRLDPAVRLARVGDDVQSGHHQAGAVADDADLAVELDVVEVLGLGRPLQRVGRLRVLPRRVVGVAEVRVVVQRHLRVEAEHPALGRTGERVDLDQGRVLGHERLPQLDRDVDDLVGDVGRELAAGHDLAGERLVDTLDRRRWATWATFSGCSCATCSISMPPATLAMHRNVRLARSSR